MRRFVACALTVALAALVGSTVGRASAAKSRVRCGATIGLIAPLTGQAAVIGAEIENWTKLAISDWNAKHRTHYTLLEGDTQLSPAVASTLAQQFASNSKIVATVGPAASQSVVAAGPILNRAHMAMVSPAATLTTLTTGGTLHDFFRVVARDDEQAPTAANFMISKLHVKNVMIVDDQSSFSTGLAASAAAVFQRAGVTVDRESISQSATDYSSLVAKARSHDLVFLTWQLPANIKLFVQQLHSQGIQKPTFATTFDGGTDYVSSFSINVHTYAPDAAIVRRYEAKYGKNYTGEFGPPSYVSAQVIMTAIDSLCAKHRKITRPAVVAAIRKVKLKHSILGRPIAFDRRGDLVNGRFYIYRLVGTTYQLVQ